MQLNITFDKSLVVYIVTLCNDGHNNIAFCQNIRVCMLKRDFKECNAKQASYLNSRRIVSIFLNTFNKLLQECPDCNFVYLKVYCRLFIDYFDKLSTTFTF